MKNIVQTLRTNELKVWTVLSTDDIYSTIYIYGTHFVWRAILDLIMCENPIIQSAVKTKPFYGFGWNLRFK